MTQKIAIIGGGLVGLTTALGLIQRGFEVSIFERAKKFTPIGSDIGLWPNGLRVFDQLGIYQQILSLSGRYAKIRLANEKSELIQERPVDFYHQIAPYDPINICRYELQDVLVQAVGIENIKFNKQCIKIEETADKVIAHFQDGTSVASDILIGADGATSFVRSYVEPDCQLDYAGYVSLGGISDVPYQLKYNLIFGKYLSGCFPVGKNRHIFFFVCKHDEVNLNQAYPLLSDQFNLFRGREPLIDEMLDKLELSTSKSDRSHYFFINNYYLRPLKNWFLDRTVLIGDAAHMVGPILGCATSVALEGTQHLIESLSCYRNDYAMALATYEKLQRPRASALLNLERKFTDIFQRGGLSDYVSFNDDLVAVLRGDSASNINVIGPSLQSETCM